MENLLKILLVEDEAIIAMLMTEQLKSIGYAVAHHAATGENAIIQAKQNKPDIILMDIRLAGEIDGIEASAAIKSESDIPIIFVTGYDDESIRKRAEKINPAGFLVKPIEINILKTLLDKFGALK